MSAGWIAASQFTKLPGRLRLMPLLVAAAGFMLTPAAWGSPQTYYIDCSGHSTATPGTASAPLRSLAQVNRLPLGPGDSLLFRRGSVCQGELEPKGSGTASAPIRVGTYGEGGLPRVVASANAAAALRLSDQEFWEIGSLDLSGGTIAGVAVESSAGIVHHIVLRDLRVHDVRGPLKHKESGLVVIHPTGAKGSFEDVLVDGVLCFDTTQWSGIFIAGAAHVRVRNVVVHDVQGDGIVVFDSQDAVIARSLAWHTGMQHQQTIGTPNAIWTWRCRDCTVEENEAFLTDSPGIDGGAFDIDFGNTRNTVQRNFGHDTDGYCVSVFAAFGPTTDSVVADNVCIRNGLAPRLAQRQGALLLMTWQGGSIDRLAVRGNRIEWQPPGDTPAIQSGAGMLATGVTLDSNQVASSGISFVDPDLKYAGKGNSYVVVSQRVADLQAAQARFAKLPEHASQVKAAEAFPSDAAAGPSKPEEWSLVMTASSPEPNRDDALRGTLLELKSAALQFGHAGLRTRLICNGNIAGLAKDLLLPEDGVVLEEPERTSVDHFAALTVRLVSPAGAVVREWKGYPGPVDLGLALRKSVGAPVFGFLPFENVRAKE